MIDIEDFDGEEAKKLMWIWRYSNDYRHAHYSNPMHGKEFDVWLNDFCEYLALPLEDKVALKLIGSE